MQPFYIADGDTISYEAHTCIVFTADGSGPQLKPMVTRSVAMEDNPALQCFNRCVDLATTYGSEVRKTRSRYTEETFLVFYNLSPRLPVNRTLARLVDFSLNDTSQLFWRGDVVVMKGDFSDDPHVRCLDASTDDIPRVQDFFLEGYSRGHFENDLVWDEEMWKINCKEQGWLGYWGVNSKAVEAERSDINELKTLLGHRILPPHGYMEGGFLSSLTSALSSWMPRLVSAAITGAPKLGPDIERAIFEMCAQSYPQMCLTLVLVARRVKLWVDPILYRVVNLSCFTRGHNLDHRMQSFYSNNLLKPVLPVGFYALHVKSLSIPPIRQEPGVTGICEQILTACSGVENLMIFTSTSFLESPNAWRRLRRLTTTLTNLCVYGPGDGSRRGGLNIWPFDHACFVNLTHLHLYDDDEDWPNYRGWENLRSLTHLALACSGPPATVSFLWRKLPSLSYMAFGSHKDEKGWTSIKNDPHILAAWPKRVVFLRHLPNSDWDSGARGGRDMWAIVEREVARRLSQEAGRA